MRMVDYDATLRHQSRPLMAMSAISFVFLLSSRLYGWMSWTFSLASDVYGSLFLCPWMFFFPICHSSLHLPLMSVYNRYAGTILFPFFFSFFIPPIVSLMRCYRFHDGFIHVFKNVLEHPHFSRWGYQWRNAGIPMSGLVSFVLSTTAAPPMLSLMLPLCP